MPLRSTIGASSIKSYGFGNKPVPYIVSYVIIGGGGGGGARRGGAGGAGGTGGIDGLVGQGGLGIASNITGTLTYYAAGGTGRGPGGIGTMSNGYASYGAGGGFSSDPNFRYGESLAAQPGVLIIRYPTP